MTNEHNKVDSFLYKNIADSGISVYREEDVDKKFMPQFNSPTMSQFTNISTRSDTVDIDKYSNNGVIQKGDIKVFIDNYDKITSEFKVSTHKLFDVLVLGLTKQNPYKEKIGKINPTVSIALKDYVELLGIPDTKASLDYTRKTVKKDLDILYRTSIEWYEEKKGKKYDYEKTRICYRQGIKKGFINFTFTPEMAVYLANSYLTQYPLQILKLDERNPTTYHLGKKLAYHYTMDNNAKKGTAGILSVQSLLEFCPDIPSYEEVKEAGRQVEQRIIAPFEKALEAIPFIKWEYCNPKGAVLTTEQLENMDYHTFIELYIKYEVIDAPDQTERIKSNEIKKAKAIKKYASKKKSQSKEAVS